MRYILLVLLLFFAFFQGICQKRTNTFSYDSIIMPDRLLSCQLRDTIIAIPFKAYNRHGKIPGFIKRTFKQWTGRFPLANPGWPANIGCSRGLFSFMWADRSLLYMGLHKNYMLLVYRVGTWGVSSHIILFKYDNRKITNVWHWDGCMHEVGPKENITFCLDYLNDPFPGKPYL